MRINDSKDTRTFIENLKMVYIDDRTDLEIVYLDNSK